MWERERQAGGELTQAGVYNINCILDVFKSINMLFYIKGGGGVQTPCLPHVGLKEREGGAGRILLVQFGLGAQASPFLAWCGSP